MRMKGDSGDTIIYVSKCKEYNYEEQPDASYIKPKEEINIKLRRFD